MEIQYERNKFSGKNTYINILPPNYFERIYLSSSKTAI